jgi:DNA-binding NarL/FixJ family response regulator
MVIEGIRSLLQQEPGIELVGHAMNAASCLAFLQQQQPDLILMDINLPDQSGIDLCKQVREKYPSVFVLGLSTFNQQSFIQRMMDNGASGYILKNASADELKAAVVTVIKGRTYLSSEASKMLRTPAAEEGPILTRREKEVLEWIAGGLTNAEISAKLAIGVTTVETYRKNLLEKFQARNVAELVHLAMKSGKLG